MDTHLSIVILILGNSVERSGCDYTVTQRGESVVKLVVIALCCILIGGKKRSDLSAGLNAYTSRVSRMHKCSPICVRYMSITSQPPLALHAPDKNLTDDETSMKCSREKRDSTSGYQRTVYLGKENKRLEEQFALQLEEQEAIYGPSAIPLCLPADLPDLTHHTAGSTRSSLSSVSEG